MDPPRIITMPVFGYPDKMRASRPWTRMTRSFLFGCVRRPLQARNPRRRGAWTCRQSNDRRSRSWVARASSHARTGHRRFGPILSVPRLPHSLSD
jgi:hypothetical protein